MSKEKRYLQWGYDSFKDTKTGEISDNHIDLLNQPKVLGVCKTVLVFIGMKMTYLPPKKNH